MKTFIQWAKTNKLDLPLSEDKLRGGIRAAYPYAYAAAQYPDAYFAPHSATAELDLANRKKIKDVAPSNGAP
jgi:hypothetical protein